MALSNLTVKGIVPDLAILGNLQRFGYTEKDSTFQLKNLFAPPASNTASTSFEFVGSALSGFRFLHTTSNPATTYGDLKLQAFDGKGGIATVLNVNPDLSLTVNTPLNVQAVVAKTLQVTQSASIGTDLTVSGTIYGKRLSGFLYIDKAVSFIFRTDTLKMSHPTLTGFLNGFTTGGVNNRLVASVAGVYQVSLNTALTSAIANKLTVFLYKNGTAIPGAFGTYTRAAGSTTQKAGFVFTLSLAVNDYLEIWCSATTSETITVEDFQLSITAV